MKYLAALIALIALSDAASAACPGPLRQRVQVFGTRARIVERVRTVVARPFVVRPLQGTVLRGVQTAGGCANGACAIPKK